jgi:hypothetical protein
VSKLLNIPEQVVVGMMIKPEVNCRYRAGLLKKSIFSKRAKFWG